MAEKINTSTDQSNFDDGERVNYHSIVIEFGDGKRGLKFDERGTDVVSFGGDSVHKYLKPSRKNIAIVLTESGNQYVVGMLGGHHAAINTENNRAIIAPEGAVLPDVHFNESWRAPGMETTPVQAVLAAYEGGASTDRRLGDDSPFDWACEVIRAKEDDIRLLGGTAAVISQSR